jgi:hypothetical protein
MTFSKKRENKSKISKYQSYELVDWMLALDINPPLKGSSILVNIFSDS